jgi:hypothetical protein
MELSFLFDTKDSRMLTILVSLVLYIAMGCVVTLSIMKAFNPPNSESICGLIAVVCFVAWPAVVLALFLKLLYIVYIVCKWIVLQAKIGYA